MVHEIQKPETSNQEILDAMMNNYQDLETDGGSTVSNCSGNIASECVRESLNKVSDALEGFNDYVLVGGIPTQMEYVRRKGHESPQIMDNFGRRMTNDLDILTTDTSEVKKRIRESDYHEGEKLKIDTIGTDLFNNTREIISSGQIHHYSAYDSAEITLNANLRVPQDTELLYTKVHDQTSRGSIGTRSDAKLIAESGEFDIENERMRYLAAGNEEAQNYLEQLGI